MTAEALALVLVAAVLHATWNIAAKRAGGDHRFVLMGAMMITLIWAPLAAWVGWHELPRWGWREWGFVLASTLVHLAYFNVLLTGYRRADLTVVYPIARGTGPLLTSLVAVTLLGESLSPTALGGLAGVTGGVFLVAGGWTMLRGGVSAAERQRRRDGLLWGAATGVLIAGYTVIDGYAVKWLLLSPILVDYFGNALRVPFMLPLALRDRAGFAQALRQQWRHALLLALLSPAAYVLVLYAVKLAPLSHVAPARECSMLVAALLGGRLLGEGDRLARLVGAAAIASGVVALALG